ncbi:MAG: serine/threonine protein kinase [Candidatus Eisenbacteria bacterium]|nr:serine/threonine protein kinase [Candidatus Eisenbacteria bacterium]
MSDEHLEQEFLIRHRLPRPISLAYDTACLAVDRRSLSHRCRWCARVALRFLAALRQAARLAAQGGGPVNPPSAQDLRSGSLAPALAAEETAAFAALLDSLDALPLERFIARTVMHPDSVDTAALREALVPLLPLARYRIVILEELTFNVLLGPRIEYHATGGGAVPIPPDLPPGVPMLVDPQTGWFLDLSPLAIWDKRPQDAFGRLSLLKRVDQKIGHYAEEGVPGGPGTSRALNGSPRTGRMPAMPDLLQVLETPPGRFRDGEEVPGVGKVLGLIWRGGTSDLFLAVRASDARAVVLKTFQYQGGILDENFWRFLGEERYTQKIEHPSVIVSRRIPPGDWGVVHEQEYAAGGSLAEWLELNGVIRVDRAVAIARELLLALQAIHEQGIVHNDVKPDNILFDSERRLKLIDFGIAFAPESESSPLRPGVPAGTVGYMAPELHTEGVSGVASDLFSAGVVLAEMVSGIRPENPAALAPLREIPKPLAEVVARMIAPDPKERFGSALEAADALKKIEGALQPARAITLDIEGTLIPGYGIWQPRPKLAEFAAFCLEHLDRFFVYTLLDRGEAEAVFEELVRQGAVSKEFARRLEYVEWPRGADGSLKDLRRCRVPLEQNMIVDDMESWVPEDQLDRWIPVRDFGEVQGVDRDLERVMEAVGAEFEIGCASAGAGASGPSDSAIAEKGGAAQA